MAKKNVYTYVLEHISPDKALEVLTDPEFDIAVQVSQESTQSCNVVVISQDDNSMVYEMRCKEYARSVTGINHNKTVDAVTTVRWDLKKRRSDWTYAGAHGKRVKIYGHTQIIPEGDGCRCSHEFNVEIKFPLVGSKIEGIVIRESAKHMRNTFEPLVREFCQR